MPNTDFTGMRLKQKTCLAAMHVRQQFGSSSSSWSNPSCRVVMLAK